MIKYIVLAWGFTFASAGCAFAAGDFNPLGEWRVRDGSAHIRMVDCGGRLWGMISWAEHPGKDEHNPDLSKRDRPVLGLPILLGLQPSAQNRWDGPIYNADNGKTYDGGIRMKSTDIMHVEGCVLKMLCGGEDWTRRQPAVNEHEQVALCQAIDARK